jgi:hypothetical protein
MAMSLERTWSIHGARVVPVGGAQGRTHLRNMSDSTMSWPCPYRPDIWKTTWEDIVASLVGMTVSPPRPWYWDAHRRRAPSIIRSFLPESAVVQQRTCISLSVRKPKYSYTVGPPVYISIPRRSRVGPVGTTPVVIGSTQGGSWGWEGNVRQIAGAVGLPGTPVVRSVTVWISNFRSHPGAPIE